MRQGSASQSNPLAWPLFLIDHPEKTRRIETFARVTQSVARMRQCESFFVGCLANRKSSGRVRERERPREKKEKKQRCSGRHIDSFPDFNRVDSMSFNYSSILDEHLSRDDPLFWSRPTPVNCSTIRIVGILLCVASLVGVLCNGALFYSFVRYKALRSPPNIFVMFIAAMGLLASCTILPLTGTSSIYCQWLYQRAGCQLSAVIAFLYGCASSYLLCGVSLSRCYIIVRPFQAKNVTVSV